MAEQWLMTETEKSRKVQHFHLLRIQHQLLPLFSGRK